MGVAEAGEMTRQDVTQDQMNNVAVLPGADIDFGLSLERPCEECGGLVDLSGLINVSTHDIETGEDTLQVMSEADARQLLAEAGIQPPPVMCDRHEERYVITTEKAR